MKKNSRPSGKGILYPFSMNLTYAMKLATVLFLFTVVQSLAGNLYSQTNLVSDTKTLMNPGERHNSSVTSQQPLTITGTVTDQSGSPMVGVTVIIKGSTQGTITNASGSYSISNVPSDGTLIFSFVGMKTKEVIVGSQRIINVSMEIDAIGIEEVVAIGYGTQKRVNLTGSVAAVSGEELTNKSVTGTIDALQGVLPGVVVTRSTGSPGQEGFDIQIRGVTSVNNNPVLVLVDGIEGDIEDVRPEDVESISVLKDAASSAIYGAKAAGGVLLVTTKKGQSGKISVEVNSYYSASKLGRIQDRISSYDAALMRNEADINSGGSATVSEAALAKIADPNILWEPSPSNPNLYVFYGDYNYKDIVLKDFTPMMSHNLAISGGSENTTFRLSTTYFENDGLIKIGPDNNKKYSGRLNLDTRIGEYLHLSNVISYSNNYVEKPWLNTDGAYGIFAYMFTYPGTTPLYDPNGNMVIGERIGNYDARIKFYDFSFARGIRKWNDNNARISSTLTIQNLVKGLQFRLVGGLDANFNNLFQHEKSIDKYGINGVRVGTLASSSGILKGQTNSRLQEFQFLTDYNLKISQHDFAFLAGYSFQDYRSSTFDARARNLVNMDLPDFSWASNENIVLNDRIGSNRFQSVFGRMTYNYRNRYLFETNLRYDGSSTLDPGDRYRFFPSGSAAWRISEESWFNIGFINEFKVRGSYGQLGNAGVLGNYDYIPLLTAANDILLGHTGTLELQQQYVAQTTLASRNITWETIESSNIGIDLSFLGNRLTFTGDYFIKNNKNMLARVAYPSVIGVGLGNLNVGELRTWGWETSIGWRERRGSLNYWINAQISDAENKLIEYLGADVYGAGTNRLLQGKSINSIYGYKTDGLFQSAEEVSAHAFQSNKTGPGDTKYLDLNDDGRITAGNQTEEDHGDLVYLGNTNPRYSFGIQGGFKWKGFDFSAFLQGIGKRVFMLDNVLTMPYFRGWFGPQRHQLDYWTPENTDAFWPRLYVAGEHNFLPSDKWVQDAAYIRLKDIQLGYTLPENLLSRIGIGKVRVYIAGHDILEATNVLPIIDPERPNASTYQYPFRRSYTIGLNLSF